MLRTGRVQLQTNAQVTHAGITWQKGLKKELKKENTVWEIENYSQGPEDKGRKAPSGTSEEAARAEALGAARLQLRS